MPEIDWRWRAEIDPFANAVAEARHPGIPNLGSVLEIDPDAIEPVDLLVFGSPCQDFSIAGKRAGMDGERGNLTLVALDLARQLRPRWLVFENVPGLLSNWTGEAPSDLAEGEEREAEQYSDMAAFLGTVRECGYLGCWRVYDAQYAGVPQRRRRIFFVGHLGDWRPAAAVLFEPESLSGNPPPRREAGQGVARPVASGSPGGSGYRNDADTADSLIAHTLNAKGGSGRIDGESETFIAHALRADGFDASEDGTGRGTPLVPVGQVILSNQGSGGNRSGYPMAWPHTTLTREAGPNAIAFSSKDHGADAGDISPTLRAGVHSASHANAGVPPAVAFMENVRHELRVSHCADALSTGGGKPGQGYPAALLGSAVRRLTPRECERLQGFPEAQECFTIRVCRDLSDQQKQNARAALQCPKSPSSVWLAAGSGWTLSADAAADHFSTSHPDHDSLVAVDVLIDLERQAVLLHSQGRSFSPAVSADGKSMFLLPTGIGSFVRLVALLTHAWGLATQAGKEASPASTPFSTVHRNGNGIVLLSGREIAGRAADAAESISLASRLFTSTTLPSGLDTQTYDSMLETLCCCVVHAIDSFIPARTSAANSYDVRLTTTRGYTAVAYRGKPAADGPRYRALGNSMAVPVMRWILSRVLLCDAALRGIERAA